jgi:protein gp37
MNKQGPNGIEWTHVFGPGTGYTWNPTSGCAHGCEWIMPDGTVAQCYAKTRAESDELRPFYSQGFAEAYWRSKRLQEPTHYKQPCGIFIASMGDLMGHWVTEDQIKQVLSICRQTPQHIYFLLTKNSPRLPKFDYPPNVWVGVSAPPSRMLGHTLTSEQQIRYWNKAIASLSQVNATVRWLSIEPLTHDVSWLFTEGTPVDRVVLGAASDGNRKIQPSKDLLSSALLALDALKIPYFFKGNLRPSLGVAFPEWREDYPEVKVVKQQKLF